VGNASVKDSKPSLEERGFGQSLGLAGKACFLVIDVINGFTDPNLPMGAELGPQIDKINEFLASCRTRDIPVVFTAIAYEDVDLPDKGIWFEKMAGLKTLMAGTEAVELDRRLAYRKGDTILTKKYASAFFGTDLSSRLTAAKIDTVIIAGTTTSGCVRATAVDAIQYGFRPIVLSDACGDRWQQSHDISMFDLQQKYADVMTTQEAIQLLSHKQPTGKEV